MSFFGLESPPGFAGDRQKFLDGQSEDIAVYEFGQEFDDQDNLGQALQEAGDDFNDETFGADEPLGKDFDFGHSNMILAQSDSLFIRNREENNRQSSGPTGSKWDDKSPFAALRTSNFSQRQRDAANPQSTTGNVMTLHEVEASMRVNAQRMRPSESGQRHYPPHNNSHSPLHLADHRLQNPQTLQSFQPDGYGFSNQFQQDAPSYRPELFDLQSSQKQATPPPSARLASHLVLPPSPYERQPRMPQHSQQIENSDLTRFYQLENRNPNPRPDSNQDAYSSHHMARYAPLESQLYSESAFDHVRHQRGPSGVGIPTIVHRRDNSLGRPLSNVGGLAPSIDEFPQLVARHQSNKPVPAPVPGSNFHDLNDSSLQDQESLRDEAMRKIQDAERMELRRHARAKKIHSMSRYNDLMTQSDKDFITRIQVSQLVTADPYADDFYAQVFGALQRSRQGLVATDERVLKFGSSGGVGLGAPNKPATRRPNAMQRMEAQVERIVSNARLREKEKGLQTTNSLQGALGKTSGRSYKAAPRQLLQVGITTPGSVDPPSDHFDDHAVATKQAAQLGREALGNAAKHSGNQQTKALSEREALIILEAMYDQVLEIEQLRRNQPNPDDNEGFQKWHTKYTAIVDELWDNLRVQMPLETVPHPFISLLTPVKGKKILPRISRHLSVERMQILTTLLVACFGQLDVVLSAPLLDSLRDSPRLHDVERQTQAFLGSVLQSVLPQIAKASLRFVSGMLGLLLDRCDILVAVKSKPGLAILTLFLSRIEVIKQSITTTATPSQLPTQEEAHQWQTMFDHLFQLIQPHFLQLFPSSRTVTTMPVTSQIESADQPVWQFLAALALHASVEQQQILVTGLREKVLGIVTSVNKGWILDEEERRSKLANVNIFLHALGLDSSQITI